MVWSSYSNAYFAAFRDVRCAALRSAVVSENLLGNLDVPGCIENSLSQCVTEKMWMNGHT
jgi:hypothetical protein